MSVYTPVLIVIGLSIVLFIIGLLIGLLEKHRIERKQDHMEYLEQKQKEYLQREHQELETLKQQKMEYERMLSELDRNTLPTKEQMKKLHWYMNHFGYSNSHHQFMQDYNQMNQYMKKHYRYKD